MTKSIEEQADDYPPFNTTKETFLDGAKAREEQLMGVVNELREALKKISDYSTLDGEKYNSYQDGWHGVADFAKRELTKADQMLKEMGICRYLEASTRG